MLRLFQRPHFILGTVLRRRHFSSSVVADSNYIKSSGALYVHTYPGSRVIELSDPDSGNFISSELVTRLEAQLDSFKSNGTVAALFFVSRSPDLFSNGLKFSEVPDVAFFGSVNKLAGNISSLKKPCLAVYSGSVRGTAYGLFAGCKYRLGTMSTTFSIPELAAGRLPLGGLAHYLAQGCREGVAIARYLAVSGLVIHSHEMYALGLLTHIVEEDPHISLADALAHTIYDSSAEQTVGFDAPVVDVAALPELVDTMHIECDIDILGDDTWNKVCLVPPSQTPLEIDALVPEGNAEDLSDKPLVDRVNKCFSEDNVSKCIDSLTALGSSWGDDLVVKMRALNPKMLDNWFRITRLAEKESLENIYRMEVMANSLTNAAQKSRP